MVHIATRYFVDWSSGFDKRGLSTATFGGCFQGPSTTKKRVLDLEVEVPPGEIFLKQHKQHVGAKKEEFGEGRP